MTNFVLWRRLTLTDFNAMRGEASPHGRGGGAMHIALGVANEGFPIKKFLRIQNRTNVTIRTASRPGVFGESSLAFASNPHRRGGEWLIRDQFSHRHPGLSAEAGFPSRYRPQNPPYLLVFRAGDSYHVRYTTQADLGRLPRNMVPDGMLTLQKGIRPVPAALLNFFDIPASTALDIFEDEERREPANDFDPATIEDARRRIVRSIRERQGQPQFRRKVLAAYSNQCAVSRCETEWVLEAAHITPYKGQQTNAISNGLLLRADIHTLFDLSLISVEPGRMRVCVSSILETSQYETFDGKRLYVPKRTSDRPSEAALEQHYSLFKT